MRSPAFLLALLLGLLVRLAALPLPGGEEMDKWNVEAVTHTGLGEQLPALRYELGLAGRLHRAIATSADTPTLIVLLKLPALLCSAALTVLFYRVTEARTKRAESARWAALAIWLNPALILNGEALGFMDPLMILPATMALLLIHAGAPMAAGVFAAIAMLTRPEGALILPALVVAAVALGARLGLLRATLGAVLAAAVLFLPFGLTAALPSAWIVLSGLYTRSDVLSASAANLWWIVSWGFRVRVMGPLTHPLPALRVLALPSPVPSLPTPGRFRALRFLDVHHAAAAGVVLWWARVCWKAWGTVRLALHAAVAALTVHIFFVLMVGLHEPQQILEVPMLALAAALESSLRPVFYTVTVIVALNLNLFNGISRGSGWAVPRSITFIDASVVVAAANVIALFWLSGLLTDLIAESRRTYSSRL